MCAARHFAHTRRFTQKSRMTCAFATRDRRADNPPHEESAARPWVRSMLRGGVHGVPVKNRIHDAIAVQEVTT